MKGKKSDNSIPIKESVPITSENMINDDVRVYDVEEDVGYTRRKLENEIIEEIIASISRDMGYTNTVYNTSKLYDSIQSRLERNKAWMEGFNHGRESL